MVAGCDGWGELHRLNDQNTAGRFQPQSQLFSWADPGPLLHCDTLKNMPEEPAPRVRPPHDFEAMYAAAPPWDGRPPWDIGRPQAAFQELANSGAIRGRVLDVGCGTGEHVLMLAARGLEVTGIDLAPTAIASARDKARERGLSANFFVGDALHLDSLGARFDTVLDSGLFHVFDDQDRRAFVDSLRAAMAPGGRYFMMCFSDRQPGDFGPRRVSEAEIQDAFREGFRIDSIEPSQFDIRPDPGIALAWLAKISRV